MLRELNCPNIPDAPSAGWASRIIHYLVIRRKLNIYSKWMPSNTVYLHSEFILFVLNNNVFIIISSWCSSGHDVFLISLLPYKFLSVIWMVKTFVIHLLLSIPLSAHLISSLSSIFRSVYSSLLFYYCLALFFSWLEAYVCDYRKRLVSLMSYSFSNLEAALAITLVDPDR